MALYYPSIEVTQKITLLGAVVSDPPNLYETPVGGRTIVKIDVLSMLPQLIEECYSDAKIPEHKFKQYRQEFEIFMCGDVATEIYQKALVTLCEGIPQFTLYFTYRSEFGEAKEPLALRTTKELTNKLKGLLEVVDAVVAQVPKRKFCLLNKYVVYYSLPYGTRLTLPAEATYID